MTKNRAYHIPVMLQPCLDGLNIDPNGVYVDVTFGGGGHSRVIHELLSSQGRLISFDQDPDAAKNAWEAANFSFVAANFAFFTNHLRLQGVMQVDGILADLGVSSHQFDEESRGFSIRGEAPLDMRMNQEGELTAAKVLNEYSEEDLIALFRAYGEINNAPKLVRLISAQRRSTKFKTTVQLMDIARECATPRKENKYFAQVFQALRIEVALSLGLRRLP